jgi:hypothetical protein
MNPKPISQSTDADMRHTQAALERAARRAREIAAQTGTAIVISRKGIIEHIYPTPSTASADSVQTVQEPKPPYGEEA